MPAVSSALRFVLLCLMLLCTEGAQARPDAFKIAPPAAWVLALSHVNPPPAVPVTPRGGVAYLLRDYQTRVEQQGKVAYFHTASKALDGNGVEQVANVRIGFDPSYQRLILHAINVIRDGTVIPKLTRAKVQILQRETELDYLVYDGSMTASVLLDDVRIGDVVEYAFSLEGSNPVFQNKVAGGGDLEWSVPVEHAFLRLLMPSSRPFKLTALNSKLVPAMTEQDGYRDYRWDQRNVPELRVDKGAPEWFDPYGAVQWSEFADWEAVVQWALPLYQPPRDPGAPLRLEIARIAREHAAPAERVAAVLKLVQREIRYLGIEVGPGSHAPTAPAVVFQRRFGDCKDKTMLTITMLRALGIDAAPALVNTVVAGELASWGATPFAFNHVLVRVRLDDKLYWLDPTRAEQQGDLAHLYQPDYGYALVLEPAGKALTPMAHPYGGQKTVSALFDSTAGINQPVLYTVQTTARGSGADGLRMQLASNKAETVTQYQNFYARSYAGIRQGEPLEVRDDAAANAYTVRESYVIPGFWTLSKNGKQRKASIEASEIDALLTAPDAVSRNAPLRVKYPYEVTETIEVRLPETWNIKVVDAEVSDPAFEFSYRVHAAKNGKGLTITAHYKALRDHVDPGDMGHYAAHLEQARDAAGYSLSIGVDAVKAPAAASEEDAEPTPARTAWYAHERVPVIAMGLLFMLWRLLARVLRRAPPEHHKVNSCLLACCMAVVALIVLVCLPPTRVMALIPGALVGLFLLSRYVLRIVPQVPATHFAFPWARKVYQAGFTLPGQAAGALLHLAPPVIGWLTIIHYVFQWLR